MQIKKKTKKICPFGEILQGYVNVLRRGFLSTVLSDFR